LRRERAAQAAQAALRKALAEYFAARYSRAHRAAQRALVLRNDTEVLHGDGEFRVLSLLLAAASLHHMQDRSRRDDLLKLRRISVASSTSTTFFGTSIRRWPGRRADAAGCRGQYRRIAVSKCQVRRISTTSYSLASFGGKGV
jgi:hypothetical protein